MLDCAPMEIAITLLIGIALGALGTSLLLRRSSQSAESIAETLSAKVLARNTEQILQLAESKLSGKKEVIDGTLKDMKDDLSKVERLMHALERDREQKFGKIDDRLENTATLMKDLSTTTQGLQKALAGTASRGQWGERMAEDVLRLSGLVEGINYIKQKKLENGSSRPDFTFMLPQNLTLNMDVKFPFSNYEQYLNAKGDADREKFKKLFLQDVKERIKEVQTRDYINPEGSTVDYVLLFIPNEQIFSFINEVGRDLVDEAMEGKTILCSPLSLYAILAVVRQSIDNFQLEGKSKEMLSLFGAFKQQWEKFRDQMDTVKSRLDSACKGYDELTGVRERQLDKALSKIDDVRIEKGVQAATLEETIEKVKEEHVSTNA